MALTVVDAGVLIGFLDRNDPHHQDAADALAALVDRGDRIVVPSSALAEVLVGPSRRGRHAVAAVLQLIERVPFEVAPLDNNIAVAAAALRAKHSAIKLPDALVLATAKALDARVLLTTDRGWPTARRLAIDCSIQII
jgi:predicted nucleic acid-binding protein